MRYTLMLTTLALAASACTPAETPPVQPADKNGKPGGRSATKTSPPIALKAVRTKGTPSALHDGGPLTCVKVTVTNNSKKTIQINPFYFSMVDTKNTKHSLEDAAGDYEDAFGASDLAPRQNVKGTVCGKGRFTPKEIAMTDPLFSTAARAQVG